MEKEVERILSFVIFLALAVVAFLLIKPFIGAILFAMVLAYLLHPLYKKLNQGIKNDNLSAAIITFVFIAIIAVLTWFIAQIAIKEAFNLYLSTQKIDVFNAINNILSKVFIGSPDLSRQLTLSIQQTITQGINSFMNQVGTVITNAPAIFLQVFVAFFVSFYFLRDGKKIIEKVYNVLPLKEAIKKRFIKRSDEITKATVYGQVVVGFIQGATAGIGFYLFGAPSPLFFSIIAVLFSVIPFIGPAIVWVPVSVIMFISGNTNGIYLFIFGIVIVSWIDNVVKPFIVGKKAKLNPIIAMIGMLGGLVLLGPIGLVAGPLILEYLLIFIRFYGNSEEKKG